MSSCGAVMYPLPLHSCVWDQITHVQAPWPVGDTEALLTMMVGYLVDKSLCQGFGGAIVDNVVA